MAAKKSKIAELVVGFVVQGAKSALAVVKQTVSAVVTATKYVAGLGALIQGGILFKAAEGTQEAWEFGKAVEYLVRVIGQAFAPYLRMVTTLIAKLGLGFRSLSPETQRWVAVVGMAAIAIAALIALAPVITAAWTAAAAVIGAVWAGVAAAVGLVLSPIGLVIVAVGGLIAAFASLFGFMSSGGAEAANSLNESNKSWVEKAIEWVQKVAVAFGKAFNWMMQQAAKASDWIAAKLADAGEFLGILPEGTGQTIRQMEPIQPFKLDVGQVDVFFERVKAGARNVAPVVKGIFGAVQGLMGEFLKPGNAEGFHLRMKVELEGLQGTYDRLLKAFAEGEGDDVQKQILEQNKAFNEKLDQVKNAVANGFDKLAREFGVVGQ